MPKSLGSGQIQNRKSRKVCCQRLKGEKHFVEKGELTMSKFSDSSSNIRTKSILEFSDQEVIGNKQRAVLVS